MSEEAAKKSGKRWYWYLGLILILQFFNIPMGILKAGLDLIEGYPKSALAQLANIFLDFGERYLVVFPTRISEDPFVGIGMLIGSFLPLVIGIWLIKKKPKARKVI
ncbi:MAG: hypothetical protein PHR43_06345 [Dehalococcoidales bacterium]|nr:hypothetical protein [Dehalococcoidales bacterium]